MQMWLVLSFCVATINACSPAGPCKSRERRDGKSSIVPVHPNILLPIYNRGSPAAPCKFREREDGKSPIVLLHGDILLPIDAGGNMQVEACTHVQFFCPGPRNYLNSPNFGALVNAICGCNAFLLENDGKLYDFSMLQCQQKPQPAAKQVGNCNSNAKLIQLGFSLPTSEFLDKVSVCFDANRLITYWTRHELGSSPYRCNIADTARFKSDFFTSVSPDRVYTQLSPRGLQRGHLTPKCDFFTGPERRMTFYYVNASPQQGNFNTKNWRDLEANIRTERKQKRLVIYTGTTRIDDRIQSQIPVPLYFWKVVIEPVSGEGISFIGVNDVERDIDSPCHTIDCKRIFWLKAQFRTKMMQVQNGKIYCCTIENLRNVRNIQLPQMKEFRSGVLRNF